MRVTLVTVNLEGGGAQRVLCMLANHWADKGWQIAVLTLNQQNEVPFFKLNPGIKRIDSDWNGAGERGFPKARLINQMLTLRNEIVRTKPQVVIPFQGTLSTIVMTCLVGTRVPVIACERSEPSQYELPFRWRFLRSLLYPRAARVTVQTQAAADFYPEKIRRNITVVPNPVVVPQDTGTSTTDYQLNRERKNLIAVGRLHEVKGYDLLISAFAKVAGRHPDWDLTIFGDGEERGSLEKQIEDLGLSGRIFLPGANHQIAGVLRQADLFAMTSHYEGFPNALCEAMACGLAVISFASPSGPKEIVRHDIDGLLVPPKDVHALSQAFDRVMGDEELRRRLASAGPEVLTRFAFDRVIATWEHILDAAIHPRSRQKTPTPESKVEAVG